LVQCLTLRIYLDTGIEGGELDQMVYLIQGFFDRSPTWAQTCGAFAKINMGSIRKLITAKLTPKICFG